MMVRFAIISVITVAVFISGCGSSSQTDEPASVTITSENLANAAGKVWRLEAMTYMGSEYTLEGKMPNIKIDAESGKVSGFASLNRYFGSLAIDGEGKVTWPKAMGSTRMAGPPAAMKQETAFLSTLPKTEQMSLEADKLIMTSSDGQYKLTLIEAAPAQQ